MGIVIAILVLAVIFLALFLIKPKSNSKLSSTELGKQGEDKVKQVLKGNIEGVQYVINDITILDKYGNKAQIDHIVINKYGVHVIETKNWSGRIMGDKDQHTWTEYFDNSEKKYELYNPILQNNIHIKRLHSIIGYGLPINNIVCFTNDNVYVFNHSNEICYLKQLKNKINSGYKKYNSQEIYAIFKSINNSSI